MTISINFNSTFHVSIIKIINFSIKTRHSWFIYFNFLFLPTSFSHNFTNLFSLSLNFIWHKFHKSKSCESNSSDLEVTNFTKFSYQTIVNPLHQKWTRNQFDSFGNKSAARCFKGAKMPVSLPFLVRWFSTT